MNMKDMAIGFLIAMGLLLVLPWFVQYLMIPYMRWVYGL